MRLYVVLTALAVVGTGCTPLQLSHNTVRQATTLADIHQQQVLDNLAMFVANPQSLPHFAYPESGINQLTDTAGIQSTFTWLRPVTGDANLNPSVQRQANDSWNLHPINDPHKLALMQCAYQRAVGCAGTSQFASACPDCESRLKDFYKGTPGGAACLTFAPGWFQCGAEKDVPKDCCGYVGRYCGVCVWVPPSGRGELTKLTLAVLDFALFDVDEPDTRTKEVVLYLNADGTPAPPDKAVKKVTVNVPIDAPVETAKDVQNLLKGTVTDSEKYHRRQRTRPTSNAGLLELRQQLRTVR